MYHLHLQVLFVPFPMLETPHSHAIVTALVSFLQLKIEPRSPISYSRGRAPQKLWPTKIRGILFSGMAAK